MATLKSAASSLLRGRGRRGVGHALLDEAEQWASAQGYNEVRLRSGVHREEAHEFYLAVGFEQSKASFMFRRRVR